MIALFVRRCGILFWIESLWMCFVFWFVISMLETTSAPASSIDWEEPVIFSAAALGGLSHHVFKWLLKAPITQRGTLPFHLLSSTTSHFCSRGHSYRCCDISNHTNVTYQPAAQTSDRQQSGPWFRIEQGNSLLVQTPSPRRSSISILSVFPILSRNFENDSLIFAEKRVHWSTCLSSKCRCLEL